MLAEIKKYIIDSMRDYKDALKDTDTPAHRLEEIKADALHKIKIAEIVLANNGFNVEEVKAECKKEM